MVSFKRGLLIPFTARWVFIIMSAYLLFIHIMRQLTLGNNEWPLMLSFFGSVMLMYLVFATTKFVEIDCNQNRIFEYVSIFWMKIGTKSDFKGIEKIYINSMKYRSNIGMAPSNMIAAWFWPDLSGAILNVYLKDHSGEKYFLFEERNKKKLYRRLVNANEVLKTQIFDNTSGVAVLISGVD